MKALGDSTQSNSFDADREKLPPFFLNQGCGIKGFIPTSVIQGNPRFYDQISLWEAVAIASQKWSFPTALF